MGDVLRALRLSLFREPFRVRRWLYVLCFSGLFLLFLGFVAVGRALITFFPGFKPASAAGVHHRPAAQRHDARAKSDQSR